MGYVPYTEELEDRIKELEQMIEILTGKLRAREDNVMDSKEKTVSSGEGSKIPRCELCAGDVIREFSASKGPDTTEQITICGRCNLLVEINDSLKLLVAKTPSTTGFTPISNN